MAGSEEDSLLLDEEQRKKEEKKNRRCCCCGNDRGWIWFGWIMLVIVIGIFIFAMVLKYQKDP